MTNYLITGIGGDIAQGISRIIRSYDKKAFLIGSDTTTHHAGLLFVNHFKVVAAASDSDSYLKSIKSLITEFDVTHLIPTSEAELETISNHIDVFKNVHVIFPGAKVVETCWD